MAKVLKVLGHLNVELVDTMVVDDNEVEMDATEVEAREARKRFKALQRAVAADNFGDVSKPIHEAICDLIKAIEATDAGATVTVEGYSVGFDKPRRWEA